MKKTNADLLMRCTAISKARPELSGKLHEIYTQWLAADEPMTLDEAWQKIDDLVEGTTIEDVTDVFGKEA